MANKRKFAYRDPNEDEYIFNCLVNYPRWAKDLLTPQELVIFKTPSSIRKYVNNAANDQKKLLLAKANIRFITMYVDFNADDPLSQKNFTKIYRSIKSTRERVKIIQEITNRNTFIVSSREVLNSAYLLAQNCHTPYYMVNQNFKRVYDAVDSIKLRGLRDYDGNSDSKDLRVHDGARDVCANFYLSSLESESYIKVTQKLDAVEMRILVYLFLHRETFIEKPAIHRHLYDYKKNSVSQTLSRLLRDGYIDVNRMNERRPSYTIAELGIIKVNELLERLVEKAVVI